MRKEIKRTIAGVMPFLIPLTIIFVCLAIENGGFAWGLLWDAFIFTMIGIGIIVICGVIIYLLLN